MKKCKTIAIVNQKGGVGKTTTTENLGIGLAMQGKKTLCVDADAQGDLTACLGWVNQDDLQTTLSTLMGKVMQDLPISPHEGILHHKEGVDLLPGNIELSSMEMGLVNAMSREATLRNCLAEARQEYEYLLIDCPPSLGMLTINALAASDSVIIPVQAQYLPAKGMTQLIQTIGRVKKHINPNLKIGGILITLADNRTNLAKNTVQTIKAGYGKQIKIFDTQIPVSVKAAEMSSTGQSIFSYDPKGKAAEAYTKFTLEVLDCARQRAKLHDSHVR